MSNLTRFYWAKLKGASNLFQQRKTEHDLDKVQDICCQLVVESRCPPLCRIEAWKLRSQCYPHNYWFAKAQLHQAFKFIAKCEEHKEAGDRALAALEESKRSAIAMLKDRTDEYQQKWKAKGRDVAPSEDEWYQIVETESSNQGPIFEFIGEPFKGSDWPFEARAVDASVLIDKTFPPHLMFGLVEPVQQQQQDTDIAMEDIVEATEKTTQKV
ncbi:hypothetical protein Q7P36_001783 [Cladosporium allicinum]